MSNRFMISVAVLALVAGTGLANAQNSMGRDAGPSSAQPTQHNAQPSGGAAEHGGSMNKESKEKGTVGRAGGAAKSGQSAEDRATDKMNKNEAAEEKMEKSKGGPAEQRAQGREDKSKGMSSQNESKSGPKDMKAEGKNGATTTNNAQNRTGTSTDMKAEGKTGTSSTTVGQAGAGAKLSTEQRTQITTVIRGEHVAPAANVNFAISVGTRVPREGIELHALPSRVVTIYPEWRAYKYILVRDEIVIIDPATYEIVAVLTV